MAIQHWGFLFIAFLAACSSAPTKSNGVVKRSMNEVTIVDTFTGADSINYAKVGTVECQGIIWDSEIAEGLKSDPEESCRLNLRTRAGNLGADIVQIERSERRDRCERAGTKEVSPCVWMQGTAYRRR